MTILLVSEVTRGMLQRQKGGRQENHQIVASKMNLQFYMQITLLEKCKTLRGKPELIMSCTHDSLKFLGAKWNLLNN